MEPMEVKLRRLRGWFVAWFVAEAFIGIVASAGILEGLRGLGLHGLDAETNPVGLGALLSMFILAVLLGLALWIFEALLLQRNWARLVLLVAAWINVAGSVTSFIGLGSLGMVFAVFPGVDLGVLTLISIATNGLKLLFWGYVIATLQFDRKVLVGFHHTAGA